MNPYLEHADVGVDSDVVAAGLVRAAGHRYDELIRIQIELKLNSK